MGDIIERILREAIEGGGIAGWATVREWDGRTAARITEPGGSVHVLDGSVAERGIMAILAGSDDPDVAAVLTAHDTNRIDGDVADMVVQFGLFGRIIYQ